MRTTPVTDVRVHGGEGVTRSKSPVVFQHSLPHEPIPRTMHLRAPPGTGNINDTSVHFSFTDTSQMCSFPFKYT